MVINERFDQSLEYKDHSLFFIKLNEKRVEIQTLGEQCYIQPKLINIYLSQIVNLLMAYPSYINNYQDVLNRTRKIEKALFDEKFLRDLKENKNSSQVQKFQIKALQKLQEIYISFSAYEILPKVRSFDNSIPSVVRNMRK